MDHVPNEILENIVLFVPQKNPPSLRLSCRAFRTHCEKPMFKSLTVWAQRFNLERLLHLPLSESLLMNSWKTCDTECPSRTVGACTWRGVNEEEFKKIWNDTWRSTSRFLVEHHNDIETGSLLDLLSQALQNLPKLCEIVISGSMNQTRKIWGVDAVEEQSGLNVRCISRAITRVHASYNYHPSSEYFDDSEDEYYTDDDEEGLKRPNGKFQLKFIFKAAAQAGGLPKCVLRIEDRCACFNRGGILDMTSNDFGNAKLALKNVHTLEVEIPAESYMFSGIRWREDVRNLARFFSTMPNLRKLALLSTNMNSKVKVFKALNKAISCFQNLQELEIHRILTYGEGEAAELLEFLTKHSSTIDTLQLPGEFLKARHSSFLPKVRDKLQLKAFRINGCGWDMDSRCSIDLNVHVILAQYMTKELDEYPEVLVQTAFDEAFDIHYSSYSCDSEGGCDRMLDGEMNE